MLSIYKKARNAQSLITLVMAFLLMVSRIFSNMNRERRCLQEIAQIDVRNRACGGRTNQPAWGLNAPQNFVWCPRGTRYAAHGVATGRPGGVGSLRRNRNTYKPSERRPNNLLRDDEDD